METLFELGSNMMIILQTLLQTLFLSDATHRLNRTENTYLLLIKNYKRYLIYFFRFVFTSGQLRRKPGRQVVTFLLVVNITLWIVNIIFTSQTAPEVTEGVWFWSTVINLSLPLCILYR